jgi:hypothetical protein
MLKRSVYQDRLRTNIGKVEGKTAFSAAGRSESRARIYESLVQKKSQYSVWDKRAWSDHPLLGRDFL